MGITINRRPITDNRNDSKIGFINVKIFGKKIIHYVPQSPIGWGNLTILGKYSVGWSGYTDITARGAELQIRLEWEKEQ